jgi:putative permease
VNRVWVEMNDQIINYIRGKVIEIVIVGIATYVPFALMGLRYSALLAVAVGFSVLIPYIGAAAVTVPVAMVALFQWGLTPDFAWLMVAYFVIQALDGNLLVPCSSPRRSTCTRWPSSSPCWCLAVCGAFGASSSPFPSPPWSKRCSTPGPSGKISPRP